ncbi:MAG: ABC transporter ATP-binding protein [Thaumarchaeota archaeon]|jgi:peptide/nickel transport system ATP-binding protein|nr:ABC transporter ATP-binding protein [Candidatus Terraquivivens yellowstonensis]
MSSTLLNVEELQVHFKVYGGILKVLNDVALTVNEKEKVGLIGESGCGKTTTMKAIMRILPWNAIVPKAKIYFKGKDIMKMSDSELKRLRRRSISMIFQDPTAALNPVFKIRDQLFDIVKYANLEMGKNLSKKEIEEEAIRLLKEAALPEPERILDSYPFQLSGGMRQRVCIAMALASAHELLIADEPGTSLDVTIEDQILRLLKQIVEEKRTSIILISHALGAVKGFVDRVYVMYAGCIVESARTPDLFREPLHPYTKGLLAAVPKLTGGGIPSGIKGRVPDYMNPPLGCRFVTRCEYAMPICEKKQPRMIKAGNDHEVACFLYGE